MAVLLDTDRIPARDRAEALQNVFVGESPQTVAPVGEQPVRRRIDVVDFGPEVHLIRTRGTALQITRDAGHVRQAAPEAFAIGLQREGQARLTAGGVDTLGQPGDMTLVDITRPYAMHDLGVCAHEALIVSDRQIGVSVDVVRAAAPALTRSSLYPLFRGHLAHLYTAARGLDEQSRLLTGRATVALVRALVTTAAETRDSAGDMEGTMEARIVLQIEAHLTDRELAAGSIAQAHHVSVRHLYAIWARTHDETLAQWIIARRLERARDQLATPAGRCSIEQVAHESGFSDASHFSRRFREAFGSTPREWRALQQPTQPSTSGRSP